MEIVAVDFEHSRYLKGAYLPYLPYCQKNKIDAREGF